MESLDAVSYTHLDVYKRQAWMEREKEALTEIAQAHEFEIISLGGGRPHMEPVSYTHLDVYKRQRSGSAGRWSWRGCLIISRTATGSSSGLRGL